MSDEDQTLQSAQKLLPEGTLSLGYLVIIPFMDLEGDRSFLFKVGGDLQMAEALGYLELTKNALLSSECDCCEDDE